MISEIALFTLISLTPAEKGTINNLERRLKKEGHDISEYINDSRFQIYKPEKGKKTVNYADIKQSWYMRPDSIEKCADFIEEYYHNLEVIRAKYEISPEHMVSQLQLETRLGQYTGEKPLINSFISIYLNNPRRREEFYRYLKDFLDLFENKTDNIILSEDIFEIRGSWAGAYGIAQAMPTLIKKYGKDTDGNGDGMFDLMNMLDAMEFMARHLCDLGFGKNARATQGYNRGDKFYQSAIDKHKLALSEVMKERSKIPPKKIIYNIKPIIPNIQYPPRTNIQETKIVEVAQQPAQRQFFIKRIIQNRRNGRRG
ncbi:MAG TPA: lytic murein transglycosylase [Candidatus Pacearchaeota archaeon]|nr:lytic murein transglycosylase [Candidatus Pacearchaeota archaeon]